ncbi:indolepyruvate ferredoxin oxidoreductase subunit alpha [Congzhengia minquanensis]|uniref:Indolepyruvate oxidoreductase subunit IorA n=1 Tax=Congzhengia minquanensis TaxID=2763657 RepID=A0A926DL21_9FIRM|nr:indolepyruvate ferredoxin oxidoreductase subunit alpha [Congzhengia minquanensis]MBC8540908.1 indolepyruvate ferredoxin oxidoreductase subunit alpha [Congzhengia minquanensis]
MKKLMLGNEAIARGAYEAGVRVVSSYPGTPSTEITEFMAKYDEIYCEWAPNEKVAVETASGASLAGGRAVSAMKHVGLNVAADPLFTMSYIGVNAGLVLCVADDPGMHSSQNEQDSRNYALASKIPMLEPADSGECKDFMKKAFCLSEKFDTPVLMRLTTRVAHSQSLVEVCEREDLPLKPYEKNIAKNVMVPANARPKHPAVEARTEQLSAFSETSDLNKVIMRDTEIGIITAGISYQYVEEALPNASVLKLGMVWPLPENLIRDFAAKVKTCYVIEELDPFLEQNIRAMGISVIGKELFPKVDEYSAALLRSKILGEKAADTVSAAEAVPVRPPVMCPGCSHRGVFYVLHKLGLNVSGDIGCYSLGCAAPLSSIDSIICMGASVSAAHGMEKAAGRDFAKKTVAVLGDSTFIHSGITGLIDIVYNKGTSTVIILDNSITGMTGHQQNPSTGFTIRNEPTRQVDLVKLAEAVGVDRVKVVDPFDLDLLEKVVKEEVAADEPSVIIAQRPCALLKKAGYSGTFVINDKCKNCKMCMKLGCPAISITENGPKINDTLCVGCGLCPNVCKFGAIEKVN